MSNDHRGPDSTDSSAADDHAVLQITRDDILQRDRLLAFWLDRLKADSARGIIYLVLAIVLPLLILSTAALIEGRFGPGALVAPSPDAPRLGVRGMSFVGDTMVWPYVLLIPFLLVLLNFSISRTVRFFQDVRSVISKDWLVQHREEYRRICKRTRHILAGRDRQGLILRRTAIGVGATLFLYNTITCAIPELF